MLAGAEALSEAHRYAEAIEAFRAARPDVEAIGVPALELRAVSGEAWALQQDGEVRAAIELMQRARALAERPEFSDVDRAEVLFRLGVSLAALEHQHGHRHLRRGALARGASGLPCDLLRADILGWRSRCHRRQRDYVAAREDVERALELAEPRRPAGDREHLLPGLPDRAAQGHYVLSRNYAQRAKDLYQQLNDERNVGRLLLTLGGLTLLLGNDERAVEHLKASYSRALDADSPADAAQALGGLATVHLRRGEYDQADEVAREALVLLQGREDYLHEICPSQLVLGRALMERGRFEEAEECFRSADAAAELAGFDQPPGGERGSHWGTCGASRRGPRGRASLPERRRGAPGNPLLREVAMKARLLLLLVNLALLAAWLGHGARSWPEGH